MFKNAITRKPGPNFANGLTSINLGEPSFELILQQHNAYLRTLRSLGLQVDLLEALPEYPDAYFVEDVAVVTHDIAVITLPGAPSREGETETIASALAKYRDLAWIRPPGTLDGGDVMMVGNHCYIGISERTNRAGAAQLGEILEKYGMTWTPVPLAGGLHLKSDVNFIGRNTLLLSKAMVELEVFSQYDRIVVEEEEAQAANSLLVNGRLLTPKGFPRTKTLLLERGFDIIELDTSEVQKMDGGLSCMSLRF
jgi:dimethylargininase